VTRHRVPRRARLTAPIPFRSSSSRTGPTLRDLPGAGARALAVILTVGLLLCLTGSHSKASEQIHFTSAAVPPTVLRQRLAAMRGERAEPIAGIDLAGELFRPPGEGPFAALVMLHGCLGPNDVADRARVERYVSWGYAVLAFDGYAPRRMRQGCVPDGHSGADRVVDALGALDYLATPRFIDPVRIAVVGFGIGGGGAISAVNADENEGLARHRFRAAVAYYPTWCPVAMTRLTAPVLILLGAHDDWSPARYCQEDVAGREPTQTKAEVIVYPGAAHAFDSSDLSGGSVTYYGHRLAYDAEKDQAAAAAMRRFLLDALRR
jgi:dienelactone hydrolase